METPKYKDTYFNEKDVKKLSTEVLPSRSKNKQSRGQVIVTKYEVGIREVFPVFAKDEKTIINPGYSKPIIKMRKHLHVNDYFKVKSRM